MGAAAKRPEAPEGVGLIEGAWGWIGKRRIGGMEELLFTFSPNEVISSWPFSHTPFLTQAKAESSVKAKAAMKDKRGGGKSKNDDEVSVA